MEKPPADFYDGEDILSHWRHYQKDVNSPDSYIDMTLFSMIAAALQRRVWIGQDESPLFLNMYTVLVGKPGLGKGMCIKPALHILNWLKFKVKDSPKFQFPFEIYKKYANEEEFQFLLELPMTEEIKEKIEELKSLMVNFISQEDDTGTVKNSGLKDSPLFCLCPTSVASFEALVKVKALSCRRMVLDKSYHKLYPRLVSMNGSYLHNSLNVFLEEMNTLFKEKKKDLIKFFTIAWDCGDYENESKKSGYEYIKACWLNLLAGTTPHDLQELYSDGILSGGFSGRTTYVYEEENRSNNFGVINRDMAQMESKYIIVRHLYKLSKMFGPVSFAPEAWMILKFYYEKIHPHKKTNTSPKLEDYMSRRGTITQKLAAAIHFSRNSSSMVIGVDSVQRALDIQERIEEKMHLALQPDRKENIVHATARHVKALLDADSDKVLSSWEIYLKLEASVDEELLAKIFQYCIGLKWIKSAGTGPDGKTQYQSTKKKEK